MVLLLYHPEVALRDCDDCRKWVYGRDGSIQHYRGNPLPRPPGAAPPCRSCSKIRTLPVEKTPEEGRKVTLSRKNMITLRRYFEHRACGGVIDDPITRKNFGILEFLFSEHEREMLKLAALKGAII